MDWQRTTIDAVAGRNRLSGRQPTVGGNAGELPKKFWLRNRPDYCDRAQQDQTGLEDGI